MWIYWMEGNTAPSFLCKGNLSSTGMAHLNMQQDLHIAAQELWGAHGSHSFVHPLPHTGISQSTYWLENKVTVDIERTPQQHEKNAQEDNDRQGQTVCAALKLYFTYAKKTISVPLLPHPLCPLRLLHS